MTVHALLSNVSRGERRYALARETKLRRSGNWPSWQHIPLPNGWPGHPRGWMRQIRLVHRNEIFAVLERPLPTGHRHLAITSLSQERPTWWEAQRIKDELAGREATAVEVYPPHDEIVDGADMYHLWVLPAPLPFSLRMPEPTA